MCSWDTQYEKGVANDSCSNVGMMIDHCGFASHIVARNDK
jgi:hypothetical protein